VSNQSLVNLLRRIVTITVIVVVVYLEIKARFLLYVDDRYRDENIFLLSQALMSLLYCYHKSVLIGQQNS